jgi:hypothetical protein
MPYQPDPTDTEPIEAVIRVAIREQDEKWDVKFDLESGDERLMVALASIVTSASGEG